MDNFKNGALLDDRPPEARARDWGQREVVAGAANVQWREKQPHEIRQFPIFNQDGSGSCVAQTEAKELGIMRWLGDGTYVHFSATDIYQRRANKPGSGMGADDARKILRDGATLEALTPSQDMSDAQMDGAKVEQYKRDVGSVFAVPNYLYIEPRSIDDVAATIQATGKGAMTWFYFNNNKEWTERPVVKDPNLALYADSTNRHSVTAVDFFLQGNEKCLAIEDSWGPGAGKGGRRIITESFYRARNFYAGYLVRFKFQEGAAEKPHFFFPRELEEGMTGDDVKALQDVCKYEGTFAANAQSTGYYGPVTRQAVGDLQVKRGIVAGPSAAGWGRFGPNTRAYANMEYGQ